MNPRTIASGLLLFTGVAHVAEFVVRSHELPMAVFGAIYFALGLWLRRPGKAGLIASTVLPAVGGLGGAMQMSAGPVDPILAGMVAIDVVVVACCVWTLARGAAAGASSA